MNEKPVGKPFAKNDPRINRSGKPRSFYELRRVAQQISDEKVPDAAGHSISRIEMILRQWSRSKVPALQRAFMEIAFGKVPDRIEGVQLPKQTLILRYGNERPGYERPNSEQSALRLKAPSATNGNSESDSRLAKKD
jgi:hypothetical protein